MEWQVYLKKISCNYISWFTKWRCGYLLCTSIFFARTSRK